MSHSENGTVEVRYENGNAHVLDSIETRYATVAKSVSLQYFCNFYSAEPRQLLTKSLFHSSNHRCDLSDHIPAHAHSGCQGIHSDPRSPAQGHVDQNRCPLLRLLAGLCHRFHHLRSGELENSCLCLALFIYSSKQLASSSWSIRAW